MNRTLLTLALAGQLAVGAAFAQTTTPSATDQGAGTGTFGSDWSTNLGSAMFGEKGTTLRAESEIVNQWATMSEEDKTMIRRDCMVQMQQSGGTTGSTTGTTGTTTGTTGTTTGMNDTASGSGIADGSMNVSAEQMQRICDATKDL
ncbi:MAG: hypothetical protein ACK4RZ_03580 [Paracoccaceae bacterium]